MNVFSLFVDARESAKWHYDGHMKLILEATQISSTVYWLCGEVPPFDTPYKKTHEHHPWVKWACLSLDHFYQVVAYGLALTLQYRKRYKPQLHTWKVKASRDVWAAWRALLAGKGSRDALLEAYRASRQTVLPAAAASKTMQDYKCRQYLLAMLETPPTAFPLSSAHGEHRTLTTPTARCGRFEIPLAFQDEARLFCADATRAYQAYYALKIQKPRCRTWYGSKHDGLMIAVAMALMSGRFSIPPLEEEEEEARTPRGAQGKRKQAGSGGGGPTSRRVKGRWARVGK